jgi:hypothetical protein
MTPASSRASSTSWIKASAIRAAATAFGRGRSPVDAVVTVVDAVGGIVNISIDAATTATLEPGHYVDALRCRVAGRVTSSLWVGGLSVSANPS